MLVLTVFVVYLLNLFGRRNSHIGFSSRGYFVVWWCALYRCRSCASIVL